MKKAKGSVSPKPRVISKMAKNNAVKVKKTNLEKSVAKSEPRATGKPTIVSITKVNNFKLLNTAKSEFIDLSNLATKAKNCKRKKTEIDAADEIKMAAVASDVIETRGRQKDQKNSTNAESIVLKPRKMIESESPVKTKKMKRKNMAEGPKKVKKGKLEETVKITAEEPKKVKKVKKEETEKIAKEQPKKMKKVRREGTEKITKDEPNKVKKERRDEAEKTKEEETEEVTEEETEKKKKETKVQTKKLGGKSISRIDIENSGHLKLRKAHVIKTIEALVKWSKKKQDSQKSLLPSDSQPIYLQVTCIKIPRTPRRHIRPVLPHALAGPLDEVAIFVADTGIGRRQDYEKTVEHWETIFREQGVVSIKEIIPMNRVKTEYGQFEMKRKLAGSFDHFLADGRICGHLTHLLGKSFFKRQDAPTPVQMSKDNIKDAINKALHKTCMEIHPNGNSHTVKAATLAMDTKKIATNVWVICETLANKYPGGWPNIRAVNLKTPDSPAIPIYMNLVSKNKVPMPVVKPKRPKAYETVKGELTTLSGDVTVEVTPEGQVKVDRRRYARSKKIKNTDEDENEEKATKENS